MELSIELYIFLMTTLLILNIWMLVVVTGGSKCLVNFNKLTLQLYTVKEYVYLVCILINNC
jgi:hypothetical protein